MNDKNNNSSSDEKPYSDSLEIFDTLFSLKKEAESSDSKKESPGPHKPSDKTDHQKVKQKVTIKKKPSTKKILSPDPLQLW